MPTPPPPTIHLTLPRPHPGQRAVLAETRRFNVLACGRRWGKTTYGIERLARPALAGAPVAWFAPTYKMLAEVWREAERFLRPVARRINASEHRIELITGGVWDMWSLEAPDGPRGRKYRRVGIDEAAMVPGLLDTWHLVIRPTLADYAGEADFYSTPRGLNDFYTLWGWGQDAARPDWASWQQPTASNPFIPPAEIAELARTLPERVFAQEVLAQFLDDGAGIFRRVREAATATLQAGALAGHQYVFGLDWAREQDWTVLMVLDLTAGAVAAWDRFQGIPYSAQLDRIAALLARFRVTTGYAEANSMGAPLIEGLAGRGIPVHSLTTTNATKAAWVDALALAFEQGTLQIPDDPVLIGELLAFEGTRLPSGLTRYAAPAGQHDDCVMGLLLAWQAATGPGPVTILPQLKGFI